MARPSPRKSIDVMRKRACKWPIHSSLKTTKSLPNELERLNQGQNSAVTDRRAARVNQIILTQHNGESGPGVVICL